MRYRVAIEPPALADIEEAFRWLAERTPERAAAWFHGIVEAVLRLENHPERCPLAPENDEFDEEIRQLLYGRRHGRYRILFTIRQQTVFILHVHHGAREHLRPQR